MVSQHNQDAVSSPANAEKSTPQNETVTGQQNRSEVAAFLAQWDLQMEAMQRGLHGMALTGRHDFIQKRMGSLIDEKKVEAMLQAMRAEQNASSAD